MDEKTLEQIVDEIPGEDGWWKRASRAEYLSLANQMNDRGIHKDVIEDWLNTAYSAAADCFGG